MGKTDSETEAKYPNPISEVAIRDIGEAAALLSKNIKLLRLERDSNFFWLIFEDKSTFDVCNLYRLGCFIVDAKKYYTNLIRLRKIISFQTNMNVVQGQSVTGG